MSRNRSAVSRRTFLKSSSLGAAAVAIPTVCVPYVRASDKAGSRTVTGAGEWVFEVQHQWPQLPDKYTWQTTHNVAVDSQNRLYVIHEGRANQPDHPSIFVFDDEARFIRAFGSEFQGGGHGIEVRQEGGEEFLYVCAYQQVKAFAKLSLTGETLWKQYAPMKAGCYAENEDTDRRKVWGRDRDLRACEFFGSTIWLSLATTAACHIVHQIWLATSGRGLCLPCRRETRWQTVGNRARAGEPLGCGGQNGTRLSSGPAVGMICCRRTTRRGASGSMSKAWIFRRCTSG
jgi:hypothetical protein